MGYVCDDKATSPPVPTELVVAMQSLEDADEFVDSDGELIEVGRSVVADSHFLNLPVDVRQRDADVWGDTPGVICGHALASYGRDMYR
jgi:hypothetical protein